MYVSVFIQIAFNTEFYLKVTQMIRNSGMGRTCIAHLVLVEVPPAQVVLHTVHSVQFPGMQSPTKCKATVSEKCKSVIFINWSTVFPSFSYTVN